MTDKCKPVSDLKKILEDHSKWVTTAHCEGSRANLSWANLSGASLPGANLSWANLPGANLSWANLSGASLSGANLSGADLSGANLPGANLSWADLSGANLSRADLSRANLSWANLPGANLSWANLSGASLPGANLSWANLPGANLSWANLSWADLSGANLQYCVLKDIKIDDGEKRAREILSTLIPPDEYKRYINYGHCYIDGAVFGLMEWVGLPDGWYCTVIKSPELLPATDRLIHRLLLWRKGKDEFLKIAQKQV